MRIDHALDHPSATDAAAESPPPSVLSAASASYRNLYVPPPGVRGHVVVRSGHDGRPARVVVADPRANSGAGVWFVPTTAGELVAVGPAQGAARAGLHGLEITLRGPARLAVARAHLGSVRELRDIEHAADVPRRRLLERASAAVAAWRPEDAATDAVRRTMQDRLRAWLRTEAREEEGRVVLERESLGGGACQRLELVPGPETAITAGPGGVVLSAPVAVTFTLRFFLGRPPLSGLARVLREPVASDMAEALAFLATGEKILAGSWQYLTYFGRDTMIAASLLLQRATPELVGVAIASVLDRVGPEGIPAHEEALGDQATCENLPALLARIAAEGPALRLGPEHLAALETPVYDTKMIDGETLLPPLVLAWLTVVRPDAEARATLFRASRLAALGRVLARLEALTRAAPAPATFLAFHPDEQVGDWRDSHEGNGLGRVPLGVNAYLVPAALDAALALGARADVPHAELLAAAPELGPALGRLFDPVSAVARREAWRAATAAAFAVTLDRATASARVRAALARLPREEAAIFGAARLFGGPATLAEAVARDGTLLPATLRFAGIALDAAGRPIPVQSSDGIFDLFYGRPDRGELLAHLETLFQPYPLGLRTPVGIVTANAALSDRPGDWALFGHGKYHGGFVVWGWQQPMLRQGLVAQRARFADDAEVVLAIDAALDLVDDAEATVGELGHQAEAWAFCARAGRIVAVRYGADAADATEANDRQLWTVAGCLGTAAPPPLTSPGGRSPRAPAPAPGRGRRSGGRAAPGRGRS